MYKKVTVLTSCLAAAALMVAVGTAWAAEEGEGGAAKTAGGDRSAACQAQAAKRNLSGTAAEDYLAKCNAPLNDALRSAAPAKLQGTL
jgi:hypothetical protein